MSNMTTTIGINQNFFRVFMKSHNLVNTDIIPPSELLRPPKLVSMTVTVFSGYPPVVKASIA